MNLLCSVYLYALCRQVGPLWREGVQVHRGVQQGTMVQGPPLPQEEDVGTCGN